MKASFTLGSAIEKAINIVAVIGVMVWVMYPYITVKADNSLQNLGESALVFEVKSIPNSVNTDQNLSNNQSSVSYATLASQDLGYQTKQAYKDLLRDYLTQRRSPFAECVDQLVELQTADKILSLSNAESGLGKRAPVGKHNYWGVGGSNLWKMGNSVCEGVQSMDNFLNEFPRRSPIKYKDMSIDRMNGLYKQPRAIHWSNNNNVILNDLAGLKSQAQQIAFAQINQGNSVVVATAELSSK